MTNAEYYVTWQIRSALRDLSQAKGADLASSRLFWMRRAMSGLVLALKRANAGARHMRPALFRAMNKLRAIIRKAGA